MEIDGKDVINDFTIIKTGRKPFSCTNTMAVTEQRIKTFKNCRQEEEPMDWEDVPFLPEVSAPFGPSRPPRKMRSLISIQVSEPPSLSANHFPNMRALVPRLEATDLKGLSFEEEAGQARR
ncbi:hypothetical protein TNCV_3840231 [Trichonephila clavipes]|nr:hypothetical protein TNCV_3840231 [Trichonephila clavipes]